MDTKWKKFKRSLFTKTVCFCLAVLVAVLGFGRAFDFFIDLNNIDDRNIDTYYENMLVQGGNFDLETSEPFKDEYNRFIKYAYRNAIVYGDGSKKAYDEYKKKLDAFSESAVTASEENILEKITEESGRVNFYHTFYYLDQGYISLEKIANTKNKIGGDYFVYNDGTYFYGSPDEYDYEEYFVDDGDIEIYDGETVIIPSTTHYYADSTQVTVTQPETTMKPTTRANAEYEIPADIIKKAGDCDAVVEIFNACSNGVEYEGYYAVTVNRDAVKENLFNNYYYSDVLPLFTRYEVFAESNRSDADNLSEYKNLYYAFYFEDEGRLVTNHPKLSSKSTKAEVKKVFSKYEWNYSKNYKHDVLTLSEGIKEITDVYDSSGFSDRLTGSLFETEFGDAASFFADDLVVYTALSDSFDEEDVISQMESNYYVTYEHTTDALWFVLIMLLLFILLTVFLVSGAGRKGSDNEVHMLPTDYIFTSVRIIINGVIIWLCLWGMYVLDEVFLNSTYYASSPLIKICLYVLCGAIAAFLLDLILYIARHIKNRSFFKNFILGRIISGTVSARRKAKEKRKAKEEKPKKEKPIIYKDIFKDVITKLGLFVFLPNVVAGFLLIFFAGWEDWGLFCCLLVPLFVYDVFLLVMMGKYAYYLRSVLKAINEIRNGNYDIWVETQGMPRSIMAYAEDVNAIRNGLKIAVDNAIKEEKTKTELITNVSHDLKTPLTSIITYVDLLSRCDIENETAKEYIEVLGEKSLRLKRLIEDLVEASKASTGNMSVNLVKASLNELIMQIAAEYEDEFAAKGLKLIIDGTGLNLTVLCDSKMSYRILDNLMNNIRKYAMPNTRVYLDVSREGNKAVVILRNISENQLNISAKELMERFVRGDASRSTEGNGLGLSIAENLALLQGGKLTVEISGDLFTARVEFLIEN